MDTFFHLPGYYLSITIIEYNLYIMPEPIVKNKDSGLEKCAIKPEKSISIPSLRRYSAIRDSHYSPDTKDSTVVIFLPSI